MKRSLVKFSIFVLGVAMGVGTPQVRAQEGAAPNPEREAARAKHLALEEITPKLQITEEVLPLIVPGHTIGETEGVSKNSKGHLFIYSRTGTGGSYPGGAAPGVVGVDQKREFGQVWGTGNYDPCLVQSRRVHED